MTDATNQSGVNQENDETRSRGRAQPGQGSGGAQEKAEGVAATADQLRRTVTERASAARDWAGEQAGVAKDWASDQTDVLRDTVQTRPLVAVGVSAGTAFAAGLVLGILLARR